jgi:hypothetical protein
MKVRALLEGGWGSGRPSESSANKKRPSKTLWFDDKELWGHDIKSRYPDAILQVDKDEDRYVAVDAEKQMCYGMWQGKQNNGCAYVGPRPIAAAVSFKQMRRLSPF